MFQGFSQATGDFLWSLAMNNDRTWFQAHKQEFEDVLNQPFRALAFDTLALMQQAFPDLEFQVHISRIYRDARRLFGRGPYKDHLWFAIYTGPKHTVGPMYWFEVGGMSWSDGMGIWEDSADVAAAWRAAIDADVPHFKGLVDDIAARGSFVLWGLEYKRPKADLGEQLNPWYNRKHISVGWERGYGGEMFTDALPRRLADDYTALMPMFRFLREVYNNVLIERAGR